MLYALKRTLARASVLFYIEKMRRRHMLKIRLQGTKKEIRWFLKGMERDSRYDVENVSTFKPCDGDARFRRLYLNVKRK